MKFLQVKFCCFGPFEEQSLDLSGPGGLKVVFGANEAGKSSALRGLNAFLFQFPGQSNDDFRFKYNQFRVHAVLENSTAQTLECIRRKGNKDTLRKACDKDVLPDQLFTDFLGGLDKPQFEQLFGLDAKRLVDGGNTITKFEGALGEALFAAGAGMKGLRVLSQRVESRKVELYLAGGKKQLITEAMREHRELVEQVRNLTLPPETYAAAMDAADAARANVAKLKADRLKARAQLATFNRYQAALPTIDLLRIARERFAQVADAPLLLADFHTKLEDAREKLTIATNGLAQLESDKQKLTARMKEERPSAAVLAEEHEIGELKKQVGAEVKSREEEFKAGTFSIGERGKACDIFRELTGSTDWEQMGGLKPRLDEIKRITELANARSAVVEDVHRQEEAVRTNKRLLGDARTKQEKAPALMDPLPWQDIVDQISAFGPIEEQYAKLSRAVQVEERRLTDEFARFNPSAPGQWPNVLAQPVPSAETVEWFRQEIENARGKVARIADEKGEIEKNIAANSASLVDKVGTEPVPTADELTAARCDRDGGIHCIRLRLAGKPGEQIENDFTTRHAPGRPLIDAAENAVRQCDTLADRLRHEADRVAVFQTLQQQLKAFQGHLATIHGESRIAEEELAAIEKRWQASWQTSGISPPDPKVMQSWLTNWTKFRERVAAWLEKRQQCEDDKLRIDSLRAQLSAACPALPRAATLAEGLASAKRVIAEASSARTAAEKLAGEVKRLQVALEEAEDYEAKARLRRSEWQQQWAHAVTVLRLNEASPSIETAQDYLKRIDQMQQHLRDMRLKDARVREIKTERSRLIERVNALRARLDPAARPTTEESLDAQFRDVEAALTEARDQRTRHQGFSKQLGEIEKKLGETAKSFSEATATLKALAAEAEVEVDAIPAAVQRARERAEAAKQVHQYEVALAQNALGEPMEAFIAAALAYRENSNQQLDDLGRRVEQLDLDVSTAEASAREAERVLEDYRQASNAAADKQQEAALLASRLEERVIEYAALHLARTVLDKAKERYRARNQDTLLDRASAYFAKLTNRAFTGIDIDNEDGADVLRAIRAAANRPDSRVGVAGLSDGTRDQLFLALRLAGIEHHLNHREPVPVIIDDVLINFDDDRARATISCLVELAKKTQVIIFTHHRHLVELARRVDPATVVIELAPSTNILT
jgi:uncharacterized protein YhaN